MENHPFTKNLEDGQELEPGSFWNENKIERNLGRGGFGTAYLITNSDNNEKMVLKVINIDRFKDSDDNRSFYNEITQMIKINPHPNVLSIAFSWIDPSTHTPYLLMEYLPNGNLWDYVKRIGQLSSFDCWWVLFNVVEGMRVLTENLHILHRDIKPQNMLIDSIGMIKISDFGLAKTGILKTIEKGFLTEAEQSGTAGTLNYMSPEQLNEGGTVDERSDIWSVGVTLYWLATGVLPFQGAKTEQDIRDLDPPAPSLINPGVDSYLNNIILRCLNKDPNMRFANFRDLEETAITNSVNIPDFQTQISINSKIATEDIIRSYLLPYFNKQPVTMPGEPDDNGEKLWLSYIQRIQQAITTIRNLPVAQEMVTNILTYYPDEPIALSFQAMIYVRSGQDQKAFAAFDELFKYTVPEGRKLPAFAYEEAIKFYIFVDRKDLARNVGRLAEKRLADETDENKKKHFESTIHEMLNKLNSDKFDRDLRKKLGIKDDPLALSEDTVKLLNIVPARGTRRRGNEMAERGLHEAALQEYKLAVMLAPDFGEAWADLGVCLVQLKRNLEAREALEKASKLVPEDSITWFHLGKVHENLGDLALALKCYEKAAQLGHQDAFDASQKIAKQPLPDFFELIRMGRESENSGELDRSLEYFDLAINIDHNNKQGWFEKGRVLADRFRRYQDALTCFEMAKQLGHPKADEEITRCNQMLSLR